MRCAVRCDDAQESLQSGTQSAVFFNDAPRQKCSNCQFKEETRERISSLCYSNVVQTTTCGSRNSKGPEQQESINPLHGLGARRLAPFHAHLCILVGPWVLQPTDARLFLSRISHAKIAPGRLEGPTRPPEQRGSG